MWFEIKVFSFFYHYYIMAEENIYYYISFLDLRSPSPSFYITFFLPFSRDWDDMVGSCFNELYMGSSNTLNMYLAGVNVTTAKFGTKFTLQLRKNALYAFRWIVRTAEVAKRTRKNGKMEAWDGYYNPWLERLRQGFGPEDIKLLRVLRKQRFRGIDDDEEYSEQNKDDIKELVYLEGNNSRQYLERKLEEDESARQEAVTGLTPLPTLSHEESQWTMDSPRPVITFMWRSDVR